MVWEVSGGQRGWMVGRGVPVGVGHRLRRGLIVAERALKGLRDVFVAAAAVGLCTPILDDEDAWRTLRGFDKLDLESSNISMT